MKIAVVVGSNRPDSGSRKVANYIIPVVESHQCQIELFDMFEIDLPMWSADMWDSSSDQSRKWVAHESRLKECDGLVVLAPEWNGTVPPSLQNFVMHLNREIVGHKPALLVGVSSGIGGTYPVAELKSSINKNNRMLLIPDHVIVRHVDGDFDSGEHPIGPRIKESVEELLLYARHMQNLRQELSFDYQTYKNGM